MSFLITILLIISIALCIYSFIIHNTIIFIICLVLSIILIIMDINLIKQRNKKNNKSRFDCLDCLDDFMYCDTYDCYVANSLLGGYDCNCDGLDCNDLDCGDLDCDCD